MTHIISVEIENNFQITNTRNITRKGTNTERKQKRRNQDNTFDNICLGFIFSVNLTQMRVVFKVGTSIAKMSKTYWESLLDIFLIIIDVSNAIHMQDFQDCI